MCLLKNNKVSFFTTKILPLFLSGKLPAKFHNYITPTLSFYLEIAKLGYLHKLNAKEVNEVLSNNTCYYKEVFDMYHYIMLIMGAIDEDRQKENKNKQGTKTREQIKKEQNMSSLQRLMGGDESVFIGGFDQNQGMITIEVTPEDMKQARKEKEARQKAIRERRLGVVTLPKKKQSSTPTTTKTSSSSRK